MDPTRDPDRRSARGRSADVEAVLRHAVDHGVLSPEEADDTLATLRDRAASAGAHSEPSLTDLVDAGILETDTLARLARELHLASSGAPTPGSSPREAPESDSGPFSASGFHDPFDSPPVADWDRYEILEFIGRGGMGDVYKARDPRLGRFVALKFLRRDDPQIVQRFTREAQVQARIDHENVCPVYEVGEVRGIPFLAMQYVAGGSLKEISHLLEIGDKAAIMVDVADALHAAHQAGLVHRDIKPANILVEREDDDRWRPFVVDFGIARDLDSQDLTVSGMVLGTPAFAAPEQVRGESRSIDARTDVYSLGATLYWFLTDQTPHQGGYGELIRGVGEREPVPQHRHNRAIPVDLETIVLKCLEHDPDRRYATAREVSEDLRRFLDREPVAARRPSVSYRLAKRIRRNPGASAAIAVFLIAFLTLAVASARSNLRARRQATIAQNFVEEVKQIESAARLAAMMPVHDWRDERDGLRRRILDLELRLEGMDDLARGPGHSALGRGWLALGELERARDHLTAAATTSYRSPMVASSTGLVLGRLYERGLAEARQIGDAALRETEISELARTLRDPALAELRSAAGAGIESAGYVEGLIAFYEDDFDAALTYARRAAQTTPWLYEASRLEGDIHVETATRAALRGDHDDAFQHLDAAGEAYRRATDIARSDAEVRAAECQRLTRVLELSTRRGRDPGAAYDLATSACATAIAIEPDRATSWVADAVLKWRWADRLGDLGADPAASIEAAVASAERAVELDPDMPAAHHTLGGILTLAAATDIASGRDPVQHLDQAIASLDRGVVLRPRSVQVLDDLGYAWERRARWEMGIGDDPRRSLGRAMEAYRRAIETEPAYPNAHNNLGIAHWRSAVYAYRSGADPGPDLSAAVASLRSAVERNPSYAYAWANLGLTYRTAALVELAGGRDPRADVEQAREALARAIELNPSIYWAHHERAAAEIVAARWAMTSGGAAAVALDAAQAAADQATRVNARNSTAWQTAAEVSRWRAEWFHRSGRPLGLELEAGRRAVERALELNPSHAAALATRAALYALQAEATEEPEVRRALTAQARASLDLALEYNPLLRRENAELDRRIASLVG
jgi:serine/threonine-protein kinase